MECYGNVKNGGSYLNVGRTAEARNGSGLTEPPKESGVRCDRNGAMHLRSKFVLTCSLIMLPMAGWAQAAAGGRTLTAYTACSMSDGLVVAETSPLAAGVSSRSVKTLTGSYSVRIEEGWRVMFAYPGEDFFANVKVEVLPKEGYAQSKAALASSFDQTIASGDTNRNYSLKPTLNGFEIQGQDRAKREGGVLGIYLFFDDPTRTVTTIYFLNQEPARRFHTMEEYGVLRDKFLREYTACIRKGL